MKKLDYIVGIILITAILYTAYLIGCYSDKQPTSDLFWINNTRIHKDSVIDCSPIYNDMLEITGSWIRVTYDRNVTLIECLDLEGSSWLEFQSSWIDAFKEQTK